MVSACAEHGCQLIDECPGCQTPLTLLGDGYAGCLCGASYGDADTMHGSALEVEFAKIIAGQSARLAGIDLCADDGLHTARTVWFISTNIVKSRTGKEGKSSYPKTVAEARALLKPIEALLLDWPTAFDNHVVQRWNAPSAEGMTAAMRLGAWYRGLLNQKGVLAEVLLSRCLLIVGTVCGDAYKTNRHQDGSTWVSAAQAGDILSIRSERVVEAVREGTMIGSQGRSGTGHLHTIVRMQDVKEVCELRARSATKEKVRGVLGVSRKQFELMEEATFFDVGCRMTPHPCVDGIFDLECIRDKVDRVRLGASDEIVGTADMISFRKINLRRTTDRTAILKIYRLIAKGELRALKFDEGDSLGDALFSEAELSRLLQEQGGAREWTAGDVAGFAGWKPECVTGWCEQGLLHATRGMRGSLEVWQISENALSRFRCEFQVVSDMAKEGKTTSRKLLASFAGRGIPSVGSQPAGSSSRGHLIRTSDIAKLMTLMPT